MPDLDHESLLKECLDIAKREGPGVAARALGASSKALAQASGATGSGGERATLLDAADAMHRASQAMTEAFTKYLAEEITLPVPGTGGGAKVFSFDSLELMAEDQVDDTVELVRAQQAVQSIVEPELVQLNALISALQGHEQVQTATNPLRSELWVKALHRALGKGGVSPSTRALWLQYLAPTFGPELSALYRQICEHMLSQGVAAASYKVSPPKHEARRKAEAARLTLRDLKRLLVNATREEGDTQGLTRPAGQTLNGMTMPAAMVALEGMNRMDDVVRRMQQRWRSGVWHAEKAGADAGVESTEYTPQQTLAREVAHIMIENISSDPRLLPDVQDVVRKLEPPLLHLVIHDQRFFTDRRHPARELLEEITHRSLAWSKESAAGFAEFIAPLKEAAQMLSAMPVQDADPFEFTLQTMRESWSEHEVRAHRQRATVAKALIKADVRNHAAASVAAALRERFDVASSPPEVRRFLLGPWSQVIAAAKVALPDMNDPGGYEALVKDITWSSQPRLAVQDTARLQGIAFTLPKKMGEALANIGASGADVDSFLTVLAAAHAKGLRGDTTDNMKAAPHSQMFEWDADALPWLSPQEVQDSMLVTHATEFESTTRDDAAAGPGKSLVAQLVTGNYIEVMVKGTWARWRLSWLSPHGTMMMFTSAGGQPESVTRAALAKLFDSGNARMVADRSVIDAALDAVAQAALENSSNQSPM